MSGARPWEDPERLAAIRAEAERRHSDEAAQQQQRGEQMAFFQTVFYDVTPKDDLHSMGHPFFALRPGDKKARSFEDARGSTTTLTPSANGLATIHDKDLLLFAISQLMHAKNAGEPISKFVRVSSSNFLDFSKRGDGGTSYDAIAKMLFRLRNTEVKTQIPTNGRTVTKAFGWIQGYEIVSESAKKKGRVYEFTMELPDWVFNALVGDEVLSLGRDYFDLGALERRLYELARKHLGKQAEWKIHLDKLWAKVNDRAGTLARFRYELRAIIDAQSVGSYRFGLDDRADMVTVTRAALPS